jgi:transposase
MSEEQELETLKGEIVEQWSHEELVKLVLRQQKLIERLEQEIEKLKEKHSTNSKTSSKPPSSDLIEKSEKAKAEKEEEGEPKRKPGGQPGHVGKTRKGFGRIDRYEISEPSACEQCGSRELSEIISYQKQQVAGLSAEQNVSV